jgi:LPXTG-motif cell wall-anchored protein
MRAVKSLTCLAIVAASLAIALPAGAHNAAVTGVASCSDGSHLVTWTITNDVARKAMNVTATATASGTAYDVSVVTNPIPGGASTNATTVVPGGYTGTITITVVATWPDEFTKTVTATVGLPEKCTTTETTAPPTTAPPTSAPPTTGPTPTSAGVAAASIVPATARTGVAGVECGAGTLPCTGSSGTGAEVAVGLGLLVVGAGLVALRRGPARGTMTRLHHRP